MNILQTVCTDCLPTTVGESMRGFRWMFLACTLWAGVVSASPPNPVRGAEFQVLGNPMPVRAAEKKVEVIEFFMYHCPACNAMEPALQDWLKKMGDKVEFRRIHLPYYGETDPEARMFLTLEALGMDKEMHARLLITWHVQRKRLRSDQDNLSWAVTHGIDQKTFLDAYNSFSVLSMMKRLPRLVESYGVTSTPTFVIDGRYVTQTSMVVEANPKLTNDEVLPAAFQVMEVLVERVAKEKQSKQK